MPINCLINVSLISEHFARCVFQNKLMTFNESNSWTLMFQKGFKKGALLARTVSPLMPINCLINFWTIREQFVFPKTIRGPKTKWKPPWWTHSWALMERIEERARRKTNNFERFLGDSTLTFLTFGNTFRLQILPTRCLVLLRGRERKIWGRQIKIRGRQIFPGCAPKIPVFKGKVTKKGGSRGSSHISIQI